MVSLVLISHSRQVAQGVGQMAAQMGGESVQIAPVGGLVDDDGTPLLGTSAPAIVAAIEGVWSASGVLLLVDLGGALLQAQMALEMLPPAMAARCLISNAPLVEGAVVAAVHARMGDGLTAVNQAAEAPCPHLKKVAS